MENRLAELRRLMRLYSTWLTVKLLGKDLVSKEDLAELKKYGKLPQGEEVDLIGNAFSLGRASALEKKATYRKITLDKLSTVEKYRHNSADKLAVREAKLHAAASIQKAVDRALAKATDQVSEANQILVSTSLIADEVVLAAKEKKTREQLAASISKKIKADITADIKKIAVTELHRAKQRGIATAIANKVDIYKKSEGLDSNVSVVPNKNACDDCKSLYLDKEKNPKVLPLKELLANGSNADPGVSHKRDTGGLHSGWKVVLPPAHPSCFCELTYVPQGMAWMNGKLTRVEPIKKAVDQGTLAAKITPKGPPQGLKVPKAGNTAGLPKAGGATPPPIPAAAKAGGPPPVPQDAQQQQPTGEDDKYEACPFGGGEACKQAGGNGHAHHIKGGVIMQRHKEYMEAKGASVDHTDPDVASSMSPEDKAASIMRANNWKSEDHHATETLEHLFASDITASEELGDDAKGINDSRKIYTKDNGAGIAKSSYDASGMDLRHEEAGYALFTAAGSKLCAPTVVRKMKNPNGMMVDHSVQAWNHKAKSALNVYKKLHNNESPPSDKHILDHLLDNSKDKDKLIDHLSEIVTMDCIMNNTDRHWNNIMVTEDCTEAYAIDHGFSFGNGMAESRQDMFFGFQSAQRRVKIPAERKEWLNKVTFSDIKRATGGIEDWRQAQTYLRAKFVNSIDDEHGYIDFDSLSNDDFERFALDYMDTHAADPSSPEHDTAKELLDTGVLMNDDIEVSTAGRKEQHAERAAGDQYEYEMYARSHHWLNAGGNWSYETDDQIDNRTKELRDAVEKEFGAKRDELGELEFKLQKEYQTLSAQAYRAQQEADNLNPTTMMREGQELTSSDVAAYQKAYLAFQAIHKQQKEAETKYLAVRKEYHEIDDAYEKGLHRAKIQATMEIIPKGQEARFKELQAKLDAARAGKTPLRKEKKQPPARTRPTSVSPSEIEQTKRVR